MKMTMIGLVMAAQVVAQAADETEFLRRKWREDTADLTTGLGTDGIRDGVEKLAAELEDREPWPVVKARVFAFCADRAAIDVSPHDWYPTVATFNLHRNYPIRIYGARGAKLDDRDFPGLREAIAKGEREGRWTVWKDYSHCCPDWDGILPLGFPGMAARLRRHWRETDYCRSLSIVADAELRFLDRLIAQGTSRLSSSVSCPPAAVSRLKKHVASLKRLRAGAPQTAYDALQFIYLVWATGELFDSYQVRTLGNLDRLLTPHYRADLAAGRTTESEFREQLRHFWWQWGSINNYWGQPVYFGGTKADGTTEYNEVSKILLDVHDELNLPTPKLHVKVAKNTPDWVWRKTLDMARRMRSISFCGEEPIARSMKSCGCSDEDARQCIIWGCYEWGVRDSANNTGAGHVNLLKPVEETLADAASGRFAADDFAAFQAECLRRMTTTVATVRELVLKNERHLSDIKPSLLLSLSTEESLRRGVDAHGGGTRGGKFSAVLLVGLGTTVDALMAVRELVYGNEECGKGRLTLKELGGIMAKNWEGHEELRRRMLRSKRKWGNNDPVANALGRRIATSCAAERNGRPNARGGTFQASGHSARHHIRFGKLTGATPDGRKAGEEMSKNISPTMGADVEGATALVATAASVTGVDLPGDCPLDLALLPSTVAGEKGIELMRTLVEAYHENGGMVVQFNVHDPEVLRDAQRHPEKYGNLQVRVCGWNVRWNDMPKAEQDKFILRAERVCR